MKRGSGIIGQWQDDGEFWIIADDGKKSPVTVMLSTKDALDFLRRANAGAAQLNAQGKFKDAA